MGTTVVGVPGTLVTIPFTSADNYVMNQVLPALNSIYFQTFNEETTLSAYTAGIYTVTATGAVVAEGYGTDTIRTALHLNANDTFLAAVNLGGGTNTVSATTGEAAAMTVVAGANTDLVMNDNATSLTAYLGGGQNWLYETSSASHANIYVAGSATTGAVGGAIINAARGDVTNVTLGTDAFLNIVTGPTTNIIATSVSGSGYDFIDIAKASAASLASVATIAATVTGAQNVDLYILNTGNAFINAESSDVIIMPGSTGNTTLYGGTGADTVIGGTGYFQGGSGGTNLLISSTLAGSTTMIGGSGDYSDTLLSYAGSNLLQGGSGSDLIWDAASAGDTLISSGGTDTIWGSASGNNTIGFGSATTDAYGDLNNSSASANIYFQNQASGTDYIFDFKTGSDTFNLSLGVGASTSLTVSSLTVSGSNTDVTLSDGTKIVFVNNTTVTNSSFTN